MKADGKPAAWAPEVAQLIHRLRHGDVRALARAVSLVEDEGPSAREILSCCFPYTGDALRIGITGSPGAGKSTLADRLARQYRQQGTSVGVVAVDPTSPFTGGAILGDRIRMRAFESDPGFYMRSMATRGSLGGLARATADVASVIEASGKQRILIETVGAGQDEIDIVRLADMTIVVLVPGMGDEMQSIKAGIMEIADIFVINKSDREGADHLENEVRAMQSLAGQHGSWIPPVLRTIGSTGEGLEKLGYAVEEFRAWLSQDGRLAERREAHWRRRVTEMIHDELLSDVRRRGLDSEALSAIAHRIAHQQEDPFRLIPQLVSGLAPRGAEPGIDQPRIDHLGIAIRSIAQARSFYESLGLSVLGEEVVEHEGVRAAMISIGDSRIELLEPLADSTPVGRFLAKRGEGLHHLAFRVEDISLAFDRLKRSGARLVAEEIQIGAGGHLYFFIHPSSASGVLVEICQDKV
jgi:LAO/AO transport system kinase